MPTTRGFTLVEMLVALVLLSVGILAMAATAGAVTTMIREGGQATVVATLAQARLEALRADACGSPGAGSQIVGDVALEWSVMVAPVPRARMVRVRARRQAQPARADSLVTVRYCP